MASNHASLATRTRYTRLDLERPRRCACGVAALAVAASLAAVAALAASPLARSGGVVAAWRTDSAAASSEPAARPRGAVSGAATGVQFVVRGEAQQVVRSVGGWLNYTLDVTEGVFLLPRGISFATRLYNGVSPAPLLLARPGDRIRLRLRNRLGPDVASPNDGKGNGLRQANTTNLHLHGIYADAVSDDTFTRVSPGQEERRPQGRLAAAAEAAVTSCVAPRRSCMSTCSTRRRAARSSSTTRTPTGRRGSRCTEAWQAASASPREAATRPRHVHDARP